MDERSKALLIEAIDSAKKNHIAPPCFEPNEEILRLIWYVMQYVDERTAGRW